MDDDVLVLSGGGGLKSVADGMGVFETTVSIADLVEPAAPAATFGLTACGDMSGFTDPRFTFEFATAETDSGDIAGDDILVVTIDSDEPTPTVGFAQTDVSVDEGEATSVFIVAEGMGSGPNEVGMVDVAVSGDALITLMQDGDALKANE